jgi:hypothetical protein
MEISTRSVAHGTGQAVAGAALLAFLLTVGLAVGASNAAADPSPSQIPKTGMKSGLLTAKYEDSAEISGTKYVFHPKVEFASEEGSPLEWKEFKKGDRVQYHLKGERIDFLVLLLPQ